MANLNGQVVRATIVAALGGFLFGFDTAVISGVTHALTVKFALTPWLLGVTVFAAVLGTVIGSMLAGIPGDRLGRRDSLRIMAVLYVISAFGCAFAWDWNSLVVARFIGGLGIGGSSVLGPMYIAEVAPARWRGRLVGVFQFNVVFGILLAYLSNYIVTTMHTGEYEWRWKLGVAAAPAIVFFILLFNIPRSPRWLVMKGRIDEARKVLFQTGEDNPEAELQDIITSIDAEHGHAHESLFTWKYRLPIFLAVSAGLFNQMTGINAILYYLNDIFEKAGFSKVSGDLQAVTIGLTNLLFTVIAMSIIDKFGRKKLLLTGAVGCAICLGGVSAVMFSKSNEYLLLPLLVGFIASFAFSQGAVIWVFIGEVFPNRVRAHGQSLGSFSHWIMNATISLLFPVLAANGSGAPFAFFAAMTVLQFFVVLFVYPETKGITLEDMQRKLGIS